MSQSGTVTNREPDQNASASRVSGRVVRQEDGRGVAGLIVEVYDITHPESGVELPKGGRRLGAVATGAQGAFQLALPALGELRTSSRTITPGRNLQLLILAPEGPGTSHEERRLYATDVRLNAGQHEEFLIRLPQENLNNAGIPAPAAGAGEDRAAAVAKTAAQAHKVEAAVAELVQERLKSVQARRRFFRESVRPALEADLTTVTDEERASGRFIPQDKSVRDGYLASVAEEVKALSGDDTSGDRPRRRTRFLLTNEQAKAIIPENTNGPVAFKEAELEAALGGPLDIPPVVYRRGLFDDPCRPPFPGEECLRAPAGDDGAGEGQEDGAGAPGEDSSLADTDGNVPGEGVEFDKGAYIARLLDRLAAPEDPVEFGYDAGAPTPVSRLTPDEVAGAISALNIEPGPADVPAFYDFHDLQIAFEPVWQEALDDDYLDDVEAAYDRFV
ncbi:MAG: hypothetical protein OEW09_13620, partial [Anaerolineae bacterium]|nr:hypothetical protein [Anaerolineae bacterium]